ncbi:amino acid ABC transporter substrate-binding protein [Pseudoalteromonas sp. NBT06-2]|uniref:substrate-binding periplasmic protein n=1 Tax=Pseudoalteromonas sp. NBT06-2 TaxID=2025950 RepID=UPI000BA7D6AA|nr:transporter substrate-binding domain-containing protein [Pseudoalteromonas sp. NBT06-2]PAJ75292.1 amino acid ABC transporter substrate-binding protein [Pseudoalteromonas sp. NBT06-2]
MLKLLNISRFKWFIFSFFPAFFYFNSTAFANEKIAVGYFKQGKYIVSKGTKTPTGYIFNKNSNKTIKLSTLDWPPYIGQNLCNKGWGFNFTVALLVSKGYQVKIDFLPWARAVRSVEFGISDILFPEYYIEYSAPSDYVKDKRRREILMLSNEFPGGMIGFLKRKGETDKFKGNLHNLKGEAIGVVRGYQNTPEFDIMMDNGEFNIVQAVDDLQLVKLLVAKRVNLIIGDPIVLRFTVNYSDLPAPEKAKLLNSIEQVKPEIQYNALYYALSVKNKNAHEILKDINTALNEFKNSGETQRIIDMGNSECLL